MADRHTSPATVLFNLCMEPHLIPHPAVDVQFTPSLPSLHVLLVSSLSSQWLRLRLVSVCPLREAFNLGVPPLFQSLFQSFLLTRTTWRKGRESLNQTSPASPIALSNTKCISFLLVLSSQKMPWTRNHSKQEHNPIRRGIGMPLSPNSQSIVQEELLRGNSKQQSKKASTAHQNQIASSTKPLLTFFFSLQFSFTQSCL